MAIGGSAEKPGFLAASILVLALLATASERPAPAADDPVQPAIAESAPRGFDLLDTYQAKQKRLDVFLKQHVLDNLAPLDQESPAADEVARLKGGLQLLIDQEAERLFREAMGSGDPEVRDAILKKLLEGKYAPHVSDRVKQEFEKRTIANGKEPFPTVEEARAAEKRLKEKQAQQAAEQAQKDLKDLDQLKDQLMSERISQAARDFAETESRKQFTTAIRLVRTQRREHLRGLIARYPDTKAAHEAEAILAGKKQENEWIASQKLAEAVRAPVNFDQRWRRMKELIRELPNTKAAEEAARLFDQHAAQVPPASVTNETSHAAGLTWDVPYSRLNWASIAAGETESLASAFPMLVRVQIDDNQWQPYQVRPGGRYFLRTSPAGIPVLFDENGVPAGKTIVAPQFGRPLPKAPPLPVWTEPHFFDWPCLYGY